jgi:putative glutamine transport system ATP-binding protein
MIKIRDLTYWYPGSEEPAIEDINADFPRERVFAVLGESGSGKTTLLNCIARFMAPTDGSITIDDLDIAEMPETEFRRILGVVFQKLYLFPHLTVLENMTLAPDKALGQPRNEAKDAAVSMLERLGIDELADRYPSQISGGQGQRVAIARGLMLQPQYMLLDEPTSALDARTTGEFAQWLGELQADTSFIIVTHDLPFAAEVATHGVYLENGRLTAAGEVKSIIQQATGAAEPPPLPGQRA